MLVGSLQRDRGQLLANWHLSKLSRHAARQWNGGLGLLCYFLLTPPFSSPRCLSRAGAYVCKGRSGWLMPLGEALWENAELQLSIPMKFKRAPPLPPPPGPATCALLLDMLAADPDARPTAEQLEARARRALEEDSH